MGLDISVKGLDYPKGYHYGYGTLHLVRWLALIDCGLPENIAGKPSYCIWPAVYVLPDGFTAKDMQATYLPLQIAGHHYPNLMLHSDCDGEYTRRGKVETTTLQSGNSVALLGELKQLAKNTPKNLQVGRAWEALLVLLETARFAVEKSNGRMEFR